MGYVFGCREQELWLFWGFLKGGNLWDLGLFFPPFQPPLFSNSKVHDVDGSYYDSFGAEAFWLTLAGICLCFQQAICLVFNFSWILYNWRWDSGYVNRALFLWHSSSEGMIEWSHLTQKWESVVISFMVSPWWFSFAPSTVNCVFLLVTDRSMEVYSVFLLMGQLDLGYFAMRNQLMNHIEDCSLSKCWLHLFLAPVHARLGWYNRDGMFLYKLLFNCSQYEVNWASEMGTMSTISKVCFQNASSWPAHILLAFGYQYFSVFIAESWNYGILPFQVYGLFRPLHSNLWSYVFDCSTKCVHVYITIMAWSSRSKARVNFFVPGGELSHCYIVDNEA